MVKFRIHMLKVVHVVRYLEEVILRIKQHVRLRQLILVLVIQRRVKGRIRTTHRAVPSLGAARSTCAWDCTTTQKKPQYPVVKI